MMDGELYRREAKSRMAGPDIDSWLKGNAIFGAIVVVGLIAMALFGSADSSSVQRADDARKLVSDGLAIRN